MICIGCCLPKALLKCGICSEPVCKECTRFLESSTFSYLKTIPEKLTHSQFCSTCYDTHIAPELASYRETMDRAKEIFIFSKMKRKMVPIIRSANKSVDIRNCTDREETILRLAFLAAQQGYNGLARVEVTSTKIRNFGYQKTHWHCTGIPVQVDSGRLNRTKE